MNLCTVGQYKMHSFETFAFEKYRDFETIVRGHSRSLTPFDRSHRISY